MKDFLLTVAAEKDMIEVLALEASVF